MPEFQTAIPISASAQALVEPLKETVGQTAYIGPLATHRAGWVQLRCHAKASLLSACIALCVQQLAWWPRAETWAGLGPLSLDFTPLLSRV